MKSTLRACLYLLGGSAVLIALSMILLGAHATTASGARMFSAVSGWSATEDLGWTASMDSEMRFYAVMWLMYGLFSLRAARHLESRHGDVPVLAIVLFVGGLARGVSWLSLGAPHPFFAMLMLIELLLPPLLLFLWRWSVASPAR